MNASRGLMLSLQDVGKCYFHGTPNQVTALDDINLQVNECDFITIIGSNGAGKSTLLKTIAGIIQPDRGRIELQGVDVTRAPVYRRAQDVGRIAQDPNESTCAVMTIEENLAMAAKRGQARGLHWAITPGKRAEFRERLAEIRLGLETRLSSRMSTLSGGQRQALALLMATMARPKVLLLDEHLANLDPKTAELVMSLTGNLVAEHGLTTLMVTHNMHQAIHWGNRLIMMHHGRIILDIAGVEKTKLKVNDLVAKFYEASREELAADQMLLSA